MTKEAIGKVIKESRVAANFTQLQVAKALGRPQQTIASWESGKSQPDANTLFKLFQVLGRSVDEAFGFTVEKFNVTASERAHIEKYRALDIYGHDMVTAVLEAEYKRCINQARSMREDDSPEIIYFTLPQYHQRMSAGTGQPAGDEWGENLLLTKQPPQGASYVATISGDSMEPTYHDGDSLFIQAAVDIQVGQVGVFFMDGQQWVKELGNGVLISHNPAYLPRPLTEDVRCQGIVLGVCDDSYFS